MRIKQYRLDLRQDVLRQLNAITRHRQSLFTRQESEALHDLRVAIRALRTVLPLLQGAPGIGPLRRQWRDIARVTGPARDLEVLLERMPDFPEAPQAVIDNLRQTHVIACKHVNTQMAKPEVDLLLEDSQSLIVNAIKSIPAEKILRNAHQRSTRQFKAIRNHTELLRFSAEGNQWHTLRILIKRQRYLLEFCNSWLPSKSTQSLPLLRQCQFTLGALHDLDLLATSTPINVKNARSKALDAARLSVFALRDHLWPQTAENISTHPNQNGSAPR